MSTNNSAEKPLDRMDRLSDLAHFPPLVNAGATINILLTLLATWWLVPRYPQVYAPVVWVAGVLSINLLPVAFLRAVGWNRSPIPSLRNMNFWRDQHRFSDWVYLAASANMAFWILLSWSVFSISHTLTTLLVLLAAAFVVTFSPVFLRTVLR